MVFSLEVLQAFHGDSLLLHVDEKLCLIDGGPFRTWATSLRPRLEQLRAARVPDGGPCASTSRWSATSTATTSRGWWTWAARSSSSPTTASRCPTRSAVCGTTRSTTCSATAPRRCRPPGAPVVASVDQGRTLRDQAIRLGVAAQRAVRRARGRAARGALRRREADRGRARRESAGPPRQASGRSGSPTTPTRCRPPTTPTAPCSTSRASSCSPRRPGSGCCCAATPAATTCSTGLETAGKLAAGGTLELDVLKLPHHGSIRNVDHDFFTRLPARHYVISADGRDGNPESAALEAIAASRADDDFEIHLTNHTGKGDLTQRLDAFVAARDAAGRALRASPSARRPRSGCASTSPTPRRTHEPDRGPAGARHGAADPHGEHRVRRGQGGLDGGPEPPLLPLPALRARPLDRTRRRPDADRRGAGRRRRARGGGAARRDRGRPARAPRGRDVHRPRPGGRAARDPADPAAGGEALGGAARRRARARVGARLVPRGPARQRPPPPLAHRLSGTRAAEPERPAAAGPPGRAVLLHAPADARPLRRRAARARLRPRRAVRRLPRADRRGLRGPPQRPGPARRRPPGHRRADRRRARAAARPPARRRHRRRGPERRRPGAADLRAAGRARGADRRHAVGRRLAPRLRPRHHGVRDGAPTAAATRATSATPRPRSATRSSGAGTATSTTRTSRSRSRPSRSRSTTRPTSRSRPSRSRSRPTRRRRSTSCRRSSPRPTGSSTATTSRSCGGCAPRTPAPRSAP